jgi:hypothetical protein
MAILGGPKISIVAVFGVKIENKLPKHLYYNFYNQALELLFLGSCAKFQP